ncbi:MAG: hypothetical protein N2253_06220 [Bacteroidia bacterium]|nr:hypothetical protein [Bacteroidia bacterium]MCX7764467.1 hypothetical protein [Bacteroidia bacterium]MDW8057051.1 hypothetical protein [Bacteroidia bacterium]
MSTRREYYKSLAEQLQVPQEIEPVAIKELLRRSARENIYEVVLSMSKRSEQILSELTEELRTKLQEINAQEDLTQRGDPEAQQQLQNELQRWVELYRSLPKPTLIALWEKLHEPPVSP